MKKIITISLGLSLCAFGMSYNAFKKYTIKNAKILKQQALSLERTQTENKIRLRSKNPTMGLEASQFSPTGVDNSFHYGASVSQTVRTSSYFEGLEKKSDALYLLQEAFVLDGKAGYLRNLEKLYTQYVYQSKLLSLLQDEYKLSKKVTNIVDIRYKNGSENKVAYLQAKTDTLALKTQMFSTKQAMNRLYYQLLSVAGLKKKVTLEKQFIYEISAHINHNTALNSKQKILSAKAKVLEGQLSMDESVIENYEVYGGIDDEPDQSVLRLGVSMALPIFNDKSEERMLIKLQSQELALEKEQLNINLYTQTQMIHASIKELWEQHKALKILKNEQQQLTDLLQEGYKISQGSIFVLMNAKNKLIQTQKSLLQTKKEINMQKTELYFIKGVYNN